MVRSRSRAEPVINPGVKGAAQLLERGRRVDESIGYIPVLPEPGCPHPRFVDDLYGRALVSRALQPASTSKAEKTRTTGKILVDSLLAHV